MLLTQPKTSWTGETERETAIHIVVTKWADKWNRTLSYVQLYIEPQQLLDQNEIDVLTKDPLIIPHFSSFLGLYFNCFRRGSQGSWHSLFWSLIRERTSISRMHLNPYIQLSLSLAQQFLFEFLSFFSRCTTLERLNISFLFTNFIIYIKVWHTLYLLQFFKVN